MASRSARMAALLCLSTTSVAAADTLTLTNGAVLQGSFGGGNAEMVIFISADGTRNIPTRDLASLLFSPKPAVPPPVAPPPVGAVPAGATAAAPGATLTIPAGTVLLTRTIDAVTSNDPPGKLFGLVLDADLRVGAALVAKAGTKLYGKIEDSAQAGRVVGKSELKLGLASIELNGARVGIVSDVLVGTGEGSFKKTARRTIMGAAIGGAVNGSKGAKRGAGAGAATTLLTPGQAIGVKPNTLLQFSLEQPLVVPT
jgi:hypothetical protein